MLAGLSAAHLNMRRVPVFTGGSKRSEKGLGTAEVVFLRGKGQSQHTYAWYGLTARECTLTFAVQLLRIEEEGAYAGLVNGSPMAKAGSKQQQQQGPGQGQRRPSWQEEEGEGDAEGLEEVEEEGAGRRASHQGAGPSGARDGSGSGSGGLSPR